MPKQLNCVYDYTQTTDFIPSSNVIFTKIRTCSVFYDFQEQNPKSELGKKIKIKFREPNPKLKEKTMSIKVPAVGATELQTLNLLFSRN